jgi:hypothetical protein
MGRAAHARSRPYGNAYLRGKPFMPSFRGVRAAASQELHPFMCHCSCGLLPRVLIEHLTKALLDRCSNERADELTHTHILDLCLDD